MVPTGPAAARSAARRTDRADGDAGGYPGPVHGRRRHEFSELPPQPSSPPPPSNYQDNQGSGWTPSSPARPYGDQVPAAAPPPARPVYYTTTKAPAGRTRRLSGCRHRRPRTAPRSRAGRPAARPAVRQYAVVHDRAYARRAARLRPRVRQPEPLPPPAAHRRTAPRLADAHQRRRHADRAADVRRGSELRGGPGGQHHAGRAELRLEPPRPPVGKTSATARLGRAGEHFRIEAVPGTSVQRYTVSFMEPYLNGSRRELRRERVLLPTDLQRMGGRPAPAAASVLATSSPTT